MDKPFWYAIKNNHYAFPTDHNLLQLTEELYSYIGSIDPELRDIIGFFVFKNWVRQGLYGMVDLRNFIPRLIKNLRKGLGEKESDLVFLRSFSALWLAIIVDFDTKHPSLRTDEMNPIREAALTYMEGERDLRGYDPIKGWAHAIDHAANLLAALAENPHSDMEDHIQILDCIANKLKASGDWIYIYDEDDCLAEVAMEVFVRGSLSLDQTKVWLSTLSADWDDAFRDESLARAFFNGRNFLRAIFWQMGRKKNTPSFETIQNMIYNTLDQTCRFMFPK